MLGVVRAWLSDEVNTRWILMVKSADDTAVMFELRSGENSTTTTATSMTSFKSVSMLLENHFTLQV